MSKRFEVLTIVAFISFSLKIYFANVHKINDKYWWRHCFVHHVYRVEQKFTRQAMNPRRRNAWSTGAICCNLGRLCCAARVDEVSYTAGLLTLWLGEFKSLWMAETDGAMVWSPDSAAERVLAVAHTKWKFLDWASLSNKGFRQTLMAEIGVSFTVIHELETVCMLQASHWRGIPIVIWQQYLLVNDVVLASIGAEGSFL